MRSPLILAISLLAACASLSEEECRAADWYQIGFEDGAEGRGLSRLEAHGKACAGVGIVPDRARWLAGREAGLRLYCTPEKAYEVGREGRTIAQGCTPAERAAMQPAHAQGKRYHHAAQELAEVRREIDDIHARLAGLPPDAPERAALQARLARLRMEISFLRIDLMRYVRWP